MRKKSSQATIADHYLRRKVIMMTGLLFVLGLFLAMAYLPMPPAWVRACLLLMGVFSSVQILTYLIAKESNPEYAKGSAVGVSNFIVFSWTALLTPFLGIIIHHLSTQHGGIETLADYHRAMMFIPAGLIIAGICLLLTRETYGKQV